MQQCNLFGLLEEGISANLEGAASYKCRQPGNAQVGQMACSRLQQERKARRGARTPALPHLLLKAPDPACLMSMLLLTWVFPRAQAPFELFLLDSSQLLLL